MPADALTLQSPDHQLELKFAVVNGQPQYSLLRNGKPVVLPSRMGFTLEWRDDLAHAFVIKDKSYSTFDETWEPVWGEEAHIRNHYNEMLVTLEQPIGSVESMDHSTEKKATVMLIRFRLYDDGLGFRYEFPIENALVCFWIKEELTERLVDSRRLGHAGVQLHRIKTVANPRFVGRRAQERRLALDRFLQDRRADRFADENR